VQRPDPELEGRGPAIEGTRLADANVEMKVRRGERQKRMAVGLAWSACRELRDVRKGHSRNTLKREKGGGGVREKKTTSDEHKKGGKEEHQVGALP